MPHYKDGTLARNGDLVLHRETHDTVRRRYPRTCSSSSGSVMMSVICNGKREGDDYPIDHIWLRQL
jgi:hypothetical protein